jgi:hypothetical protein
MLQLGSDFDVLKVAKNLKNLQILGDSFGIDTKNGLRTSKAALQNYFTMLIKSSP